MEQFNFYTFSDFVNDNSFIDWIKNRTDDEGHWQEWLRSDPANLSAYNEAKIYLLTVLSAVPIKDDVVSQELVWESINKGIAVVEKRRGNIRTLRIWSTAVAAAICIFIGGVWYYNSKIEVMTGFGEHLTVVLPDHSVVKLNANSQLSYFRAWKWHSRREVWLQGEALFDVMHLNKQPKNIHPGERFSAHAGDVSVEVLGTLFNIKNRHSKVLVALLKGKISVSKANSTAAPVVMDPGSAVQFAGGQIKQQLVSKLSNKPIAWTEHKMMASGMTVASIIENFEDTYGGRVILDNPGLLNKQIDGTISVKTRESTLYMLANLLNATLQQSDGVYYLKSK